MVGKRHTHHGPEARNTHHGPEARNNHHGTGYAPPTTHHGTGYAPPCIYTTVHSWVYHTLHVHHWVHRHPVLQWLTLEPWAQP